MIAAAPAITSSHYRINPKQKRETGILSLSLSSSLFLSPSFPAHFCHCASLSLPPHPSFLPGFIHFSLPFSFSISYVFFLSFTFFPSPPVLIRRGIFPDNSDDKESTCNAGDLGSIPGLGRSPGEGKGCPLQYSGLENPMDYGPWGRKELDMN